MEAPKNEAEKALISKLEELIASAARSQNTREFERAEETYREIIAIVPDWAEAQSNLASALHEQGKLAEARQHYERALALKPGFAEIHYNLANLLKEEDHLKEAAARYEVALTLKPGYAEAHNNLGITLQQQRRPDEAVAHYQRALAINPNYAEAHNNLGSVLQEQRKLAEARVHHEKALALRPDYAEAHNNLGIALQQQARLDEAVAHYQRALELKPAHAKAHNNLGTAFKEQGRFKEATAHYEKALALKPDFAEAHYNRSELMTFRQGDPHLAALESLAARIDNLPESKRLHIHFALAKALDDVGDYARAFEHMLAGNALKRREVDYDEARTGQMFRLIRETFVPELFDRFQATGDASPRPIFVLGMPRSGSTLIEQILASHPAVHGAGEIGTLNVVAMGEANPYPAYVSTLDAAAPGRLGRAYLAGLPEFPPGKTRITDKSPLNFLHVGLIHLILPNARIIHTVRDPVDTCISCFSKLFTFDMQFSYDLAELGRYYRYYRQLMAHWRSVLPAGAMLDVYYEQVVGDLEGQARRLLDYCSLPWDDRCLSFHKTNRPVTTASAVQVRQPLFRGSVDRRRHYQDYLQPLLAELSIPVVR